MAGLAKSIVMLENIWVVGFVEMDNYADAEYDYGGQHDCCCDFGWVCESWHTADWWLDQIG